MKRTQSWSHLKIDDRVFLLQLLITEGHWYIGGEWWKVTMYSTFTQVLHTWGAFPFYDTYCIPLNYISEVNIVHSTPLVANSKLPVFQMLLQ